MAKSDINYQSLNQELNSIMTRLQSEETGIDEAVKSYERGMQIIDELQAYLKQAKNKVQKIKARFDKPKSK